MSIYTFDVNYVSEKLMPPALRKTKHLAWLKVLFKPLQQAWNNVFVDYADGSSYSNYSDIVSYVVGDKVVYSNKKVYECIKDSAPGILPEDTTYWVKINDNFIGARERAKYNSQKILFEYALNKYFQIGSAPFIYIENNFVAADSVFLMANAGEYSSTMPSNSIYQEDYLGYVPDYGTGEADYTIFVPVAVFNTLGSNTTNRERAIRAFADIYNLAGMTYDVQTF